MLEGVFIKWEKISVWWRRNSNLLAWSSACGRGDGERKGRKRGEKEMSGIKNEKGGRKRRERDEWYKERERREKEKSGIGRKEDKGVEKREGKRREEKGREERREGEVREER